MAKHEYIIQQLQGNTWTDYCEATEAIGNDFAEWLKARGIYHWRLIIRTTTIQEFVVEEYQERSQTP